MTPKAAILKAQNTPLLSNTDKPWFLHCNEHNIVLSTISTYDYSLIIKSLLCDCQLQEENEFLY